MQIDPLIGALDASSSGMAAQSLRLRMATENLANADTPGYQRKLLHLMSMNGEVSPSRVTLDDAEGKRIYDPSHPLADENGTVLSSNVDMLIELSDSREASRHFEANLQAFGQARRLYSGLLEILQR